MIDRIKGKLLRKSPTEAIIDVGGIAFAIAIPLSTSEKLDAVDSETTLVTYLYVREDALLLFGFSTERERNLFVRLLGISGVGPKMGLAILSRFKPDLLAEIVSGGDARRLTTVPGIGKKTAERLMLEFKNRLDIKTIQSDSATGATSVITEAIQALEALGIPLNKAEDAIRKARSQLGDEATVEDLVRNGLKR
ncbi:MAG: Holliday junction branch migration protein RuvA [Candidatus Electryoneaceae bacterium]|nr:Holliday junction branch migration protein RuvA [Candidatus Electryoneaceae bacterium]